MPGYGGLLAVFVIAVLLAVGLHLLTTALGPRARNPVKDQPFECGNLSAQPFRQRVSVRFYVVALLFIIFDMETVFLFPWAVVFRDLGWPGFVTMLSFVAVLGVGLVYVWRRGALDWE